MKIDDRRQTDGQDRKVCRLPRSAEGDTRTMRRAHGAGLVQLVGAVRVTLKVHPVCRGGVPGIELDARLGPDGLAGVPQRRRRNSGAKVDGMIGIIIEV